jgi:hypothetical protein
MNLVPSIGGAYLLEDQNFPNYIIEVRQMSWRQWRASAIKLDSGLAAIDSPYCNTAKEAIENLRNKLLMGDGGEVMIDEKRWGWWSGTTDGVSFGPFATREEAIEEAMNAGAFVELEPEPPDYPDWRVSLYVVEGVQPTVDMMQVEGDDVLENLECCRYEDWVGEDGFFDVTDEQQKDLTDRLTRALHEWAAANGIAPRTWMFVDTRNDEMVILPHPQNEKDTKTGD